MARPVVGHALLAARCPHVVVVADHARAGFHAGARHAQDGGIGFAVGLLLTQAQAAHLLTSLLGGVVAAACQCLAGLGNACAPVVVGDQRPHAPVIARLDDLGDVERRRAADHPSPRNRPHAGHRAGGTGIGVVASSRTRGRTLVRAQQHLGERLYRLLVLLLLLFQLLSQEPEEDVGEVLDVDGFGAPAAHHHQQPPQHGAQAGVEPALPVTRLRLGSGPLVE